MRRSKSQQADPRLLTVVRDEFARFRREHPGPRPRIPEEYRRVARAAVAGGHAVGVVEEAAGIGRTSLAKWRNRESAAAPAKTVAPKTAGTPEPKSAAASEPMRELRIVKDRPVVTSAAGQSPAGGGTGVVRLGRQVAIEMPVAAMTESFLRALAAASLGGEP